MIQAIETRYAGHRFRSRLEARWAVFFDHLGIHWQYEHEGYLVEGRPYLPDFVLTDHPVAGESTAVEVKGDASRLDVELLSAALEANDSWRALLILGEIPRPDLEGTPAHGLLTRRPDVRGRGSVISLERAFFGWRQKLKAFHITVGRSIVSDHACVLTPLPIHNLVPYDEVPAAYEAARTARFEHGETPERPT